MLPIEWAPEAVVELEEIVAYIARDSARAAEAMRLRIEASILPAAEHPYMFRPGRVEGTREVVAHPNYLVVYRVLSERIRVVTVIHARRQYPPLAD
jgi:toxin ParE1/3/4